MGKTRKEMGKGKVRNMVSNMYCHHEFLIIIVATMVILVLAIWATKPIEASGAENEPVPFQILKERAEKEMAIETWEKIMAVEGTGEKERGEIEELVVLFVKDQIEWNCGYTPTHIHPVEVPRGAKKLLWYAREVASMSSRRIATPLEWDQWHSKYFFHYKVVKEKAEEK